MNFSKAHFIGIAGKGMKAQAPSLFFAALKVVSVSENQNEARFLAGPIGSGIEAKFSTPTFFFCWPLEPELCRYMGGRGGGFGLFGGVFSAAFAAATAFSQAGSVVVSYFFRSCS